jgi:dTDP-glucose 4,6-dehydratase
LDFAEEILELTGSSSQITFKELPKDDPQVRQPDITKAKAVLGWEPTINRSEGLTHTLDYFKQVLNKKGSNQISA